MSAPLAAALAAFAVQTLPPERIDRIWIFPPRAVGEAESALAVIAAFEHDPATSGHERRRIFTVRAEATRGRGRAARTDHVEEQGSAPLVRLPKVIRGVVQRLGSPEAAPAEIDIGGDAARWAALLAGAAQT